MSSHQPSWSVWRISNEKLTAIQMPLRHPFSLGTGTRGLLVQIDLMVWNLSLTPGHIGLKDSRSSTGRESVESVAFFLGVTWGMWSKSESDSCSSVTSDSPWILCQIADSFSCGFVPSVCSIWSGVWLITYQTNFPTGLFAKSRWNDVKQESK